MLLMWTSNVCFVTPFVQMLPLITIRNTCLLCVKSMRGMMENSDSWVLKTYPASTECGASGTISWTADTLQWRHNGRGSVSNHQPHYRLLNRKFRRRSKKTSKLRVTRLCAGNSPATGEFPAQMASNAENVSIWWRHHQLWARWWLQI